MDGEYTAELEYLFLQYFITYPDLFVRCKTILSDKFFEDKGNRKIAKFLQEHSDEYGVLPVVEQILVVTGKSIEKLTEIAPNGDQWFLDKFQEFCRHKALELAILNSLDLLKNKTYGEVETQIKAAVQLGLVDDLGTDYFYKPAERLKAMLDNNPAISTGWETVDEKLYGGLNRGDITVFCGQSGTGKSLFLQNLCINWAKMGLNVVYITLELNEQLTAQRLDAMISGFGTRHVMRNIDDAALRVVNFKRIHKGCMQLKQIPNGSNVNDIRAYIKEYELHAGLTVDAILVDYLDLMSPVSKRISLENMFVKDKYVSEELRNLATELNCLMVTASQLNRSSYDDTIEYDASHIAGGISKVNTSDNVIGIFTTYSMRESGKYQIQFMKTRNSASTGEKLFLRYDIASMRITDAPPEDAIVDLGARVVASLGNLPGTKETPETTKAVEAVAKAAGPDDFQDKMLQLQRLVSRNKLDE